MSEKKNHPRISRLVTACILIGASANAWCQQERMTLERNMEFRHKITLEATQKSRVCAARVEISYSQRNTIAETEGTIHTADCAAASGVYTIAARYRDENGEIHSVETEETWARTDDQPVHFSARLTIGDNVDLVRVRARKIRCECAADGTEQIETQGEDE